MHQNLSSDIEIEVFSTLCWKIGTPLAYKAALAVRRGEWLWLCSIDIDPASYSCALTLSGDLQIAAFFKKYKGFDLGIDKKAMAIKNFWACEAQCYQSNERLNPLLFDLGHYGERMRGFIQAWRKEIRAVLGRAPDQLSLDGRFGPGSTFRNLGDEITLAHKLSDDYSTTRQAMSFLHSWDLTAWSRYAACGLDTVGDKPVAMRQGVALYPGDSSFAIRSFEEVRGNRFTSVDKDAKKDRGICIEPSLNVFYQLAVGTLLSDRMRRYYGWDKQSCQAFHKVLAQVGSLTGAIVTVDLSNASDTVCRALVKLLLPRDWFDLLDRLRSSHTRLDNRWVRLEKFSSMGNGYTFELETLLFRTLIEAVKKFERTEEDPFTPGLATSVFGDDLIFPTSLTATVVSALNFFGFTVNESKTFVSGKFRESCGGDYYAGHNVRPHYQKEVCNEPHRLIALANGIRRFGRLHGDLGGDSTHRAAWFKCLDAIPRQIRICRGPEELGDLVIHDEEERWRHQNPLRVRNCIRYLRVWRPVSNRVIDWEQFRPGVVLSVALYGGSSGAPNSYTKAPNPEESLRRSGVVPRIKGSYVSGYRFGRVAYS